MKILRLISVVTRENKIKIEFLKYSIKLGNTVVKMRENRVRWLGHVLKKKEFGSV